MATTPPPKFPAGGAITVHAAAALTGGRMVRVTAEPSGGNAVVNVPAAGGRTFGVLGEDVASGAKGVLYRPGQLVWIEAGATLAAGDLIEATVTGVAIVRTTGIVQGEVVQGAASGALALVDYRPAQV